ncbi:helix-hairpin-helix domain-containing protein [Inmirania thermothiophila]|uniref:Helix-hairpin-helix protein n=1 Tax=Inmirania thermothiophila TaxID=1750597 RepID=A0A3N1YBW5_9GAMM|nr:helix-hairpin-helix domain-containing protein [Inmirania thermothiophila]ROR35162.1 helix-hairpin-helix protein [Inmirania thermothiophila]
MRERTRRILRRTGRALRRRRDLLWAGGVAAGGGLLYLAAGRTAYETAFVLALEPGGMRAAAAGLGATLLVLAAGEPLVRAGLAPWTGRRSPTLARAGAVAAPLTGAVPVGLAALWSAGPLMALGLVLALAAALAGAVHRLAVRWGGEAGAAARPAAPPTPPAPVPHAPPRAPAGPALEPVCARFLRAAGVRVDIAARLAAAGYRSLAALAAAGDEELLAIRGVGPATVRRIRARLGPPLSGGAAARSGPARRHRRG